MGGTDDVKRALDETERNRRRVTARLEDLLELTRVVYRAQRRRQEREAPTTPPRG